MNGNSGTGGQTPYADIKSASTELDPVEPKFPIWRMWGAQALRSVPSFGVLLLVALGLFFLNGRIENQFVSLESRLDARLTVIEKDILEMRNDIDELKLDVRDIKEAVTDLRDRVGYLEGRLNGENSLRDRN